MKNEINVQGVPGAIKIEPYEHHTEYHETSQQGTIHPSNYINWIENARMNLMEQVGLGDNQMEDMEVMSPLLSLSIEYRKPVKFDDTIIVDTKLISYDGYQMEIAYRIYDKETGEDRAVAKSKHCFVNKFDRPISLKVSYPELDTRFFEFK